MTSSAPGLHSGPLANTGESFHSLEVMSPSAMAYLLEVIAADINKTDEDIERYRRNSGAKVGLPSGERPSDEPQRSPGDDDHRLPVSAASILAASTSTQPTFTNNSSITDNTQNLEIAASTLVDVTNNQQHLTLSDHNDNTNKPHPSPPKARTTSQRPRKRTIDEDGDDNVETLRSKKKSRSSTSEEENCSQLPPRRRSSTCSIPSPKPKSTTPLELSTAVVPPTIKDTEDTSTTGADDEKGASKKARSRRFKEDEISFLDAVFKTEPYPDPMITERLSIQLDVSEHRIKVWFANRRHRQARDRVQKMTNMMEKKDQLVTETAAVPTESSHASSAFPRSVPPSYMPPYGMVPSGYGYTHPSTIPSAIPKHTPDLALSAEAHLRAQIASTIQARFPFSSPALLQLANQTMLSRSGLNQCQPLPYSMTTSGVLQSGAVPSGAVPSGAVPSGDICDLGMPRRRPSSNYVYYVEPPILPPLPAESTSYTDGMSLSPAIADSPSPWHWMP